MERYLVLTDAHILKIAAATRRVGINSDPKILAITLYFETMYLLGEDFDENIAKEKNLDSFITCMRTRMFEVADYHDTVTSAVSLSPNCDLKEAVLYLSNIAEDILTYRDSHGIESLIDETWKFYQELLKNKQCDKKCAKANKLGNEYITAFSHKYCKDGIPTENKEPCNVINTIESLNINNKKDKVVIGQVNTIPKKKVSGTSKKKIIDTEYYKNGETYHPVHQNKEIIVLRRDLDGKLYGYSMNTLKSFFTTSGLTNSEFDKKCKECINAFISFKDMSFDDKKKFIVETLFMEQQSPFLMKYIKESNLSDTKIYRSIVSIYSFWAELNAADNADKKESDEVTDNTVLLLACEKLISILHGYRLK